MSLVYSALLPHSPLLVPNIGKENRTLLTTTLAACEQIANALAETKPELVLVVTNQGIKLPDAFVINTASRFISDLRDFGDLVTQWQFTGSLLLPPRLRERLEGKATIRLVSNENLDYASAIALSLAGVGESTPILPLSVSTGSLKEQYNFGVELQSWLLREDTRLAIIGAVDLSHKLGNHSPAGYAAKAKKLDQKIITAVVNKKTKEFLSFSPEVLTDTAMEDGNVIALVLGLLDGFNYQPKALSYESPFGVGHAVISLTL